MSWQMTNLSCLFWDELEDPENIGPCHHQVPLSLPEEGTVEAVLHPCSRVARPDWTNSKFMNVGLYRSGTREYYKNTYTYELPTIGVFSLVLHSYTPFGHFLYNVQADYVGTEVNIMFYFSENHKKKEILIKAYSYLGCTSFGSCISAANL